MKTFVNILPWNFRRRELLRQRLFQWSVVWGIGLVLAAGAGWFESRAYKTELQVMQVKEGMDEPLQRLKADSERMRAQLNELSAKDALVVQLQDQPPPLVVLGLASQSARQCGGRIWLKNLQFQWTRKRLATTQQTASDVGPTGMLTLQGTGEDNLAVAEFVATLRETECFDRVELKSSVGMDSSGVRGRSYLMECRF